VRREAAGTEVLFQIGTAGFSGSCGGEAGDEEFQNRSWIARAGLQPVIGFGERRQALEQLLARVLA